jgi:hypothetical protein
MASLTTVERLARWLHDAYFKRAEQLGQGPAKWSDLSNQQRENYRAVAGELLNRPPSWLRKAMS